jgi:hypothetical protein
VNDLSTARDTLLQTGCSCVLVRDRETQASRLTGIRPLLCWLQEDATCFRDAALADKILGKAAALLLVYGGMDAAGQVYGQVLSDGAAQVLEHYRIPYAFETRVPHIINRTGTGMCPMEQRVRDLDPTDPQAPSQAYEILAAAVEEMRQNAQQNRNVKDEI